MLSLTAIHPWTSHFNPSYMQAYVKKAYMAPETTVLELEVESSILVGSGGTDPLIPEDI